DGGDTFPGIYPPQFPPPFPPDPPPVPVLTVAIASSGVVYKVVMSPTAGTNLFRSEDRGVSWTQGSYPVKNDSNPPRVLIDPNDDKVLYLFSLYEGIFRSMDGGRSWTLLNRPQADSVLGTGTLALGGKILLVGTRTAGVWQTAVTRARPVRSRF